MKQVRKVLPELKPYFWQSDSKFQVAKCADQTDAVQNFLHSHKVPSPYFSLKFATLLDSDLAHVYAVVYSINASNSRRNYATR